MSEYDTANEHVLCFQIGKLKRRIADLSQALGLITTLKPTMVMDADHPLDMAKEVVEYMTTIIANTQQANRGLCANYIYELNENIKLTARIAKLEAERRWIPVSERLPEIEEGDSKEYDVVITYPRESSVTVAWWAYNIFDKTHQRRIWIEDQGEFGHEDITKYVTHWRERPTPPEAQE